MAADEVLNMIVVENPTPNLREAIQELVKIHADAWWHEMPDVWIVSGGSAATWRDRITPLKTAAGTAAQMVLVVRLPTNVGGRHWAAHGGSSPARLAWFHEHYTPALSAADDDIPF